MKMGMPRKNLPASGSYGGGERCLTCVRSRLRSSKLCERCSGLARTDITRLFPLRLFLTYCHVCSCYLYPPGIHVRAERNSNKLLNHCIRCIWRPLTRTLRLLNAEFIESSDHNVIKVKLHLRGEISEGAISDRYHLTEFTVRHKVCKFCCETSISDAQRRVTRVELRQHHVQLRNTLSFLEKAMSEHGLTCRALRIQEHVKGTDYMFSDRTHALDLVQFIEGVIPVKKQSSATFFSLHIIPICRDDLISGSLVGGGDNLVICTEVAAHGISLMDPFTLQAAFLTAEDYWRAPFHVMFNSKLLVEYLVLDIVPDPPVADDVDSYCLAHAYIVRVSDLGKRDDHNKLMVRTHLGRLLKPGDYVLGYDVGSPATEVILVKKGCQLEKKKSIGELSSQEPRSVDTVLDGISKDEYEEFLREFEENTRLGLIDSSPHQISKESQMLPTSSDDVPSNPEGKWLGDETATDNTAMEWLPSTQLSSPQQIHGQQNGIGDIQQQEQRMPIQQNNLLNMQQQQQQQQQIMNQQAMSLHQQQQQQLGSQNNMSGLQQQQQLLGSLPITSNLQPYQRAMLLQQQQQQQQTQHLSLSLLQSQGQQSQLQPSQQPLMSQFQSQPTQMQQPSNSLEREMQQILQGLGSLLQAHNAIKQKPLIQTQRALQEVSSRTSADSTAQTGHACAIDWQEELYQKLLSLKELYYADLSEFHHKMKMKLQQREAQVLTWKQSDQLEKLKGYNIRVDRMLQLMQISSKNSVPDVLKGKFHLYEKQVVRAVTALRRSKKIPPQAQGQQLHHPNVGNAQPVPHQQPSHANQVQQALGTSLHSSASPSKT